jgi:hypothetical protein
MIEDGPNEHNTWRITTKKYMELESRKEIDEKTENLKADLQKQKEEDKK